MEIVAKRFVERTGKGLQEAQKRASFEIYTLWIAHDDGLDVKVCAHELLQVNIIIIVINDTAIPENPLKNLKPFWGCEQRSIPFWIDCK